MSVTSPLCVFDLDGTLLNTLHSLHYTVNLTLGQMKLGSITEEQCRLFVGNGTNYLLRHALAAVGAEDRFEETKQRYLQNFATSCTYQVHIYDGLLAELTQMKQDGFLLAVLTNKPQQMSETVLETYFGKDFFDMVIGQEDGRARKPDPAGVELILRQLQVKKDHACYIGDSETDCQTARNAELKSIAVTWGFRSEEVLMAEKPNRIIHQPGELYETVKHLLGLK